MNSIFNQKRIFLILEIIVALEFYHFFRQIIFSNDPLKPQRKENVPILLGTSLVKPFCKCSSFKTEYILIEKYSLNSSIDGEFLSVNLINRQYNKTTDNDNDSINLTKINLYNLSVSELKRLRKTCDLYNVLRRGKHQKIIAYSLYGTNPKYTRNLEQIPEIIRMKYKNYTARVYYDKSVESNMRCQLECNNSDVLDFCNVDRFSSYLNEIFDDSASAKNYMDLTYMHKMMWRFLPVGDSFVDVFMSRDTDSLFTDREIDSVNEWLGSINVGHIMRGYEFIKNI